MLYCLAIAIVAVSFTQIDSIKTEMRSKNTNRRAIYELNRPPNISGEEARKVLSYMCDNRKPCAATHRVIRHTWPRADSGR